MKFAFIFCLLFVSFLVFPQDNNVSLASSNAANGNVQPPPELDNFINSGSVQNAPGQTLSVAEQEESILPFGASLFSHASLNQRRSANNPNYQLAPGDKVSVQLWGAVNQSAVHIVDNQYNLFIPNVGPIKLENTLASDLNGVVSQKIKQVYTDNVNIYVNLLASTPVGVLVSGGVMIPGEYAGTSNDSVLHFLKRAGGIDAARGSYRDVKIIRQGNVVQQVDLYEFLTKGRLASHSFKDGDVVLVSPRGSTITVRSDLGNTMYEFSHDTITGQQMLMLSKPDVSVSHIAVKGVRNRKPMSQYVTREAFSRLVLADGDELLFNEDLRPQVISVELSGSYLGPSYHAVSSSTKLVELLDHVEVNPEQADVSSVYIIRESVKEQQQALLEASLSRLERSVYTAPASSDGEARLRSQEAQLVAQFIERARQIEPVGKVVVSLNGKPANIRLEQSDTVVIPAKSDLVNISGEVMLPQAVVFANDASIDDYVSWAGGFTDRANQDDVVVIHANGATSVIKLSRNGWFSAASDYKLQAGDQVLILPKVDEKLMQSVKDITQIIFQIAVAANVALD
ncbi:polysaccharide biosynthesis/export family protein [Agaribacter marinus]|uniref:Polysialic acid transporter n=1 Tax=Agaribacter marinus TaxID=1431249 RepID=A0AA37SYH4_9ALTE|nr:polysaccharide biosynthesis/export family protein [Agaribacter marinus]GLR70889.1 polysialic acid transporter [Agaribacter marinus]